MSKIIHRLELQSETALKASKFVNEFDRLFIRQKCVQNISFIELVLTI